MENIAYVGLSQQMALQRQMEITANNLANMGTSGFKSESVLFQEYLNKTSDGSDKLSQVLDAGSFRDLSQGTLSNTSNTLDFAIQGDGYFAVQTPQGVKYTRDGGFSLNNAREIVTKAGFKVLNDAGSPLTVPADASKISLGKGGVLTSEKGDIGKIKLVTFNNPHSVVPIGNNLLDAIQAQEQPVKNPNIVQGMLETSNVQPVTEMNRMIEILRLFQATQNMLMTDHDRQRSMIQKLTRV